MAKILKISPFFFRKQQFTEDGGRQIEEQKIGVVYAVAARRSEQEDEPFGVTRIDVGSRRVSDSLAVRVSSFQRGSMIFATLIILCFDFILISLVGVDGPRL